MGSVTHQSVEDGPDGSKDLLRRVSWGWSHGLDSQNVNKAVILLNTHGVPVASGGPSCDDTGDGSETNGKTHFCISTELTRTR